MKIIIIIGLLLILFCFSVRHPHQQYLIFPVTLFAIGAAFGLQYIFIVFKSDNKFKLKIWGVILLVPFLFLFFRMFEGNQKQLKRIEYVLENTVKSDHVYDGDIKFNLFRSDLHYFWYSVKKDKGLDTYNRISGGRFKDYDIVRLILRMKPKFISNYFLNPDIPALKKFYQKTPHRNLYVRIEK